MKSDIDALMRARSLDAIVIHGNAEHNPPMYYLTGGGHINNAILIKKVSEKAVLFCNDMERDEASKCGCQVHCFSEFPMDDYLAKSKGDLILANALRMKDIFKSLGLLKGTISIYRSDRIQRNLRPL